jgi:outer membrane protein assembly factor BamA
MNFAITAPPVRVGSVQLQGVSPAMQTKIKSVADHATGSPFDTANTSANLEHALQSFYQDEGYAAVKVHAIRAGNPAISPTAIDIPFSVSVEEGSVYKLGSIHLPADALVTQADIDKATAAQPGGQKQGVTVRSIWILISSRYKSKGYLDCAITPHPLLNDATGTVDYAVDINRGPVYHLGLIRFDNVSDDLRKLLMRNWQLLPGDPFDDSYVAMFLGNAQRSDPILQRTLATVKASFDVRADPVSHDVNLVIKLEKIH